MKGDFRKVFRRLSPPTFTKPGRRHPVTFFTQGIEPTKAFESAGEGDGGDGHMGIGEELFSQQQALCLPEFDRRDAKLIIECPAHLPIRDVQFFRQFGQRMFRQKILADEIGRVAGKLAAGFHEAVARRELGAASLAWTESSDFGSSSMAVEPAAFTQGSFHPADGAAINPRGFHRHEKPSVEARVARQDSLVTLIRGQVHDETITRKRRSCSPFSEVKFRGYRRNGR